MSIPVRIKRFGMTIALDCLEQDPDANLPRLMEWIRHFVGVKLPPYYAELFRRAMSDPGNNWYQLLRSMYTDIDNRVLKKLFENFIIHGELLEWPERHAAQCWPQGNAPWSVLIDPSFSCAMDCEGCGAAVYGVRPEMGFDRLDEEITQRKRKGTYLYILSGSNPLEREQEVIALCNKHTDCVFAAFTLPQAITEKLVDDMLRVCNLFPAIRTDEDPKGAERAAGLLRRNLLPFGVACRCTAETIGVAASEAAYDRMIANGAKFCWFFTCPAYGPECAPTLEQMQTLHRQVEKFRKTKPLLTLDFWDGPSPAIVQMCERGHT